MQITDRGYFAAIVGLMLVLPVASIAVEAASGGAPLSMALVGRWFVFWTVGVRLLLAGVSQIARPERTASGILGIKGKESWFVVRELGFANVSMGTMGVASVAATGWTTPAALTGAIFYALAGVNHWRHAGRNAQQSLAMVSDLAIAVLLFACFVALTRG